MNQNLPVILLSGTFLMPNNEIKVEFSDEASKNIVDEASYFHKNNVLVVAKDENGNLPKIGTLATVTRKIELPNGQVRATIKGIERINVIEYIDLNGTLESLVSKIDEVHIDPDEESAIIRKLYTEIEKHTEKVPYMSNSLLSLIADSKDLGKMTDIIVSNLSFEGKTKYKYIIETNPLKRAEMILEDLYKEAQLFDIEDTIDTKVKKELDSYQRDIYLKEKIKLLKRELGEISPKEEEIKYCMK